MSAQETESTTKTIQLFDGQSLAGFDADPSYWSVRDGAIVGQIPPRSTLNHNTWLVYSERSFADFDMRFEFQISGLPAANSGVQFRSQVESIRNVSGYQADLDMGKVWLGRIYDEHGRALLVERGTRVAIDAAGKRQVQVLAPPDQYAVLFREGQWNDYRIVAVGHRVAIWINGTLFCEMQDHETGEFDLEGFFAWQLHSGPETLLKFRNLQVEILSPDDICLGPWLKETEPTEQEDPITLGTIPTDADGQPLNLGFETGTLEHWTATGDAFRGQPVSADGISQRWPDQRSNKVGEYFIGGYEVVGDRGVGTLTSDPFLVTQPFASFMVGGGRDRFTRVEIQHWRDGEEPQVLHTASGLDREEMQRVLVDLQAVVGQKIRIHVVDENPGAWGHLNFDDFRFHDQRPVFAQQAAAWRSTANPILQHLIPNPQQPLTHDAAAAGTLEQMYVPPGFAVEVVAAEPRVHQPMAFTFDGRGRLWVVEGHSYPERRAEGEGLDRVLVFSDEDGDGHFETQHVFYEKLNLVSALEVGHGGVWVGAAPELLFIPDRDGDLQPDGPPIVLLDGFGYADTHETINNFCWGPDGWLYGNQGVFNQSRVGPPGCPDAERIFLAAGVFRYHPSQHKFEVFAHGGSNQWGLDYDQHGQWFMTHCRSFFGGGPTTHVVPGGHYWNQVNSGYADFISAQTLDIQPAMKNYLLASAQYGHGEGGAGKPGSRAVYGGHSHVGTMLYLGDNWPSEYRNRLFTHNLHGHQINQQVNLRQHGGYQTLHAGQDVFFCSDPQYIGVDLKYGPDGAVYISDWYDPRHCHNPNVEQWDRGNGRLYRMQYSATYRSVKVNLPAASDAELVAFQSHTNHWYARQARLELAYRGTSRAIDADALELLRQGLRSEDSQLRLHCLWCLHGINALTQRDLVASLADSNEYLRGWAVRLASEQVVTQSPTPPDLWQKLWLLAQQEQSLLVKRELASAAQRLPSDSAWKLAEVLAKQPENATDSELVSLLWYAIAPLMKTETGTGLRLSDQTALPVLQDYIRWFAAKTTGEGRDFLLRRIALAENDQKYHLVRLLQHAVQGLRGVPLPETWRIVAADLYDSPQAAIRQSAEVIGASFRDPVLFNRLWTTAQDEGTSEAKLIRSLEVLSQDQTTEQLPWLLSLLDRPSLVKAVLPLLRKYETPEVSNALISRLGDWDAGTTASAMELLTSRNTWASDLLDAYEQDKLPANLISAYHVRQMVSLNDESLSQRLEVSWGKAASGSAELQEQIRKIVQNYEAAPLWAYETNAGKQHYQLLCANCHQDSPENLRIAPSLAGSGSKGVAYMVENIVDPNAVVGRDFQAQLILTTEGRVITGLVVEETPTAITIRTATQQETVARDDIEEIKVSDQSFMPEGLLNTLEERQRIELLKYLLTL